MADGGSGDAADHEVQSVFTSVGVILPTAGGGLVSEGSDQSVSVVLLLASASSADRGRALYHRGRTTGQD